MIASSPLFRFRGPLLRDLAVALVELYVESVVMLS